MTELYRTTRAATQEGGANTLFLALDFLSWTRDAKDAKRHRAPLILIPVTLQRKSVRSGFSLVLHDDEPRFNPTASNGASPSLTSTSSRKTGTAF